jgi:P4 family phage/plasmid primase-like protien
MASNKEKIDVPGEIPHFLKSLGIIELRVVGGKFYRYTVANGWKVQKDAGQLTKEAYEYAEAHQLGDLTFFSNQMLDHLKIRYYQPDMHIPKHNHHLLKGGMVLDATTATIIPNKKDYYLIHSIGAGYNPEATCPLFLEYLDSSFAGVSDKNERIAAIQEFAASMFLQDTRFQDFMILHGVGGEGKSILLSAIRSVIGRYFSASIPITDIGERFKTHRLDGKLANLSDESQANVKVNTEILKALTAGNILTVEQKNKDADEMINHSKMIFAMNQFPMLGDSSKGMERRMMVISFPNPVSKEKRDKQLQHKIAAERDGIFLWLLEGLKRILVTDEITMPPSSLEIVKIIMMSDPLTGFVNDCLTILPPDSKPSQGTINEQVYTAYKRYCEHNGSDNFLTANNFSRRITEKGVVPAKSNGRSYFKVTLNNVESTSTGRRSIKVSEEELEELFD